MTQQPSKDTACLCDASLSKSLLISGVYPPYDANNQLKHGLFNPYHLKMNKLGACVVLQQPKPVVKETPREVILRAYATGILDGIGPSHLSETMQQNHASVVTKQHRVLGAESRPVVPAQSKTPRTKSSWDVTRGLHLMSHTKASQGENRHLVLFPSAFFIFSFKPRPSVLGCFHPLAKAKQQQTAKPSKDTASTAAAPLRRSTHTSGPSSSKLDLGILKKRTSTLLPAASPASGAAPAARPHLEPKQVVLTLPVVHFKPLMFLSRGANPQAQ